MGSHDSHTLLRYVAEVRINICITNEIFVWISSKMITNTVYAHTPYMNYKGRNIEECNNILAIYRLKHSFSPGIMTTLLLYHWQMTTLLLSLKMSEVLDYFGAA